MNRENIYTTKQNAPNVFRYEILYPSIKKKQSKPGKLCLTMKYNKNNNTSNQASVVWANNRK